MSTIRNNKLTITLIIILFLSVGLSLYSILSYKGDSSSSSTSIRQGFKQQGGDGRQNGGGGGPGSVTNKDAAPQQRPQSQTQPSDDKSPNNRNRSMPAGRNQLGASASSSSADKTPLALYAILFFSLTAVAFYRFHRNKMQNIETNKFLLLWTLLGTGFFLRIAAAPWILGHPYDVSLFKSWAASAANNLSGFYLNSSSDYPPFYIYILYAIGKLAAVTSMSPYFTLLIKLPSILADVATAYLLYRLARKYVSLEAGLLIGAFYTFNPAILINSTFWGQVDSFFTLIIVAAIYFLSENKLGWSTVCLTAAVLMKPQGIIYLPLLLFALVGLKKIKPWFVVMASALVTALIIVVPFSFGQNPLWLLKLFTNTVNGYPYASVNAFNFFSLLGANYKPDTSMLFLFSYHTWGMAFIVIITLFTWWMYIRSGNAKLTSLLALLQISGVFTFASSMHERYLFPAAALALLAYVYLRDKRLLWLSAGFSLTIFINTYVILYYSTNGGASYSITMFVTSLLNVLLCIWLAKVVWELSLPKKDQKVKGVRFLSL